MKFQSDCPQEFKEYVFEKSFALSKEKCEQVWDKLQRRETFVDGQIFPYQVNFDAAEQKGPFLKGELNIHHGPLLSVHGIIGDVRDDYRDLQYFYGSYVLSFRLVRPVRLEFFRDNDYVIKMRITSYIKPWFLPLWNMGNEVFWKFFGITFLF